MFIIYHLVINRRGNEVALLGGGIGTVIPKLDLRTFAKLTPSIGG